MIPRFHHEEKRKDEEGKYLLCDGVVELAKGAAGFAEPGAEELEFASSCEES